MIGPSSVTKNPLIHWIEPPIYDRSLFNLKKFPYLLNNPSLYNRYHHFQLFIESTLVCIIGLSSVDKNPFIYWIDPRIYNRSLLGQKHSLYLLNNSSNPFLLKSGNKFGLSTDMQRCCRRSFANIKRMWMYRTKIECLSRQWRKSQSEMNKSLEGNQCQENYYNTQSPFACQSNVINVKKYNSISKPLLFDDCTDWLMVNKLEH